MLYTSNPASFISFFLTSTKAFNVSKDVITSVENSVAVLLILNPSLVESFPLVGVFITISTCLFLIASNILGLASSTLLTISASIPLSFRVFAVPSVATKVYPNYFISLAISINSSLS